MKRLWFIAMATIIAIASFAPKPASAAPRTATVLLVCLPLGSFCENLPPPAEQCCGGLFCKPVRPGSQAGVCTHF